MGEKALVEQKVAGRSILIVEDESLVTMLLEDILGDLGCEIVGAASRFDEAAEKLSVIAFDLAILDVNLDGRQTFPLAEMLRKRRKPFVFATGYGASTLPERLRNTPVLSKPFDRSDLEQALKAALSGSEQ
jgi:CheY-like chemotaxis protein